MTQEWNEKAIYLAALDLEGDDREAFVRGACPDGERFDRIMALLAHAQDTFDSSHPPPNEPARDEAQGQFIDEFRIVRMLGQGGMGTVYLAHDTVLDRQVALKVIARHLTHSPRALDRFMTEAKVAAKLKHPGIVPVFRFGCDGRDQYLVTEYIEGPTLADEIAEHSRRGLQSTRTEDVRRWQHHAVERAADVAEALDHAHRQGVTHRDVKPSNILIDANVGPRLADFGIALQAEAGTNSDVAATTLSHEVLGSCYYMSPEQAAGGSGRLDHRSDIFSLGVVLYEMVTLRRPFDGGDVNTVLRAVETQQPKRPRSIDRRVTRDLEVVMLKCLEKRPVDRYQSAAHLAADLRAVLSGQPILARPPGPLRRAVRLIRQHRTLSVSVLIVLLVTALAAMAMTQFQRQRALGASVSFEVLGGAGGAILSARRWNNDERRYGKPIELGRLSSAAVRLTPGVYRFLVTDGHGRWIEFEDVLATSSMRHFALRLDGPADPVEGMVRFDPAEVSWSAPASFQDPQTGERMSDLPLDGAFWLDATEVSNKQYRQFVEATGAPEPVYWQLFESSEIADLPVTGVSRDQMLAYALWRGKRLPTIYEWLFAAQYPDGKAQLLPWGGDPDTARLAIPSPEALAAQQHIDPERLFANYRAFCSPVGSRPEFGTPTGVLHMFANVREMTSTVVNTPSGTLAVLAGGCWSSDPRSLTCMDVSTYRMDAGTFDLGFRCARSAEPR